MKNSQEARETALRIIEDAIKDVDLTTTARSPRALAEAIASQFAIDFEYDYMEFQEFGQAHSRREWSRWVVLKSDKRDSESPWPEPGEDDE